MRILSLELHGFKSFPDRTKINFDSGVTVIVGPNGSGKSNISDAIRWVLGELSSKTLRGTKMEDVIFGGTDNRSPMGFAEVSITFENSGENAVKSEYDVITVTRRYYRSGDSEYLINNKTVRLRDITDLFMNTGIGKTGYSIVGQGRVSEIISLKSEDRRTIFEEAAGISKYRLKKQESERRLEETDLNLTRVTDILREQEVRLPTLEKESAKARIYMNLYEQKKALDVSLAIYDVEQIHVRSEETEKAYVVAKHELEICEDTLNALDTQNDRLFNTQQEAKMNAEKLQYELNEVESKLNEAKTRLMVAENELSHKEADLSASAREKTELDKKIDDLKKQLESEKQKILAETEKLGNYRNQLSERETALENVRQLISDVGAETDAAIAQKESLENEYTQARIELSGNDASGASLSERQTEMQENIEDLNASIVSLQKRLDASRIELEEYKKQGNEAQDERTAMLTKLSDLEAEIALDNDKINALSAEIAAREQRADTLRRMEEHFDGYQKSTKFILESAQNGHLDGICGPVSRIISADRKLGVAIETALGGNLQNVVVENEAAAKKAIAFLSRENAGRATFYPVTSMRPYSQTPEMKRAVSFNGYVGVASELVRYDQKYANVVSNLLGRTLIFDNLENASALAKATAYSVRIVTLDGQIINAGGSFTGGSAKLGSGILTRGAEIEDLLNANKATESELSKIRARLAKRSDEKAELNTEISEIADKIGLLSTLYRSEENAGNLLSAQIAEKQSDLEALIGDAESLEKQDKERKAHSQQLTRTVKELEIRISQLTSSIAALNERHTAASLKLDTAITEKNASLVQISVQQKVVESAERDRELCEKQIAEATDAISASLQRAQEYKNSEEKIRADMEEYGNLVKNYTDESASFSEKIAALTAQSASCDKELFDIRQKIKEKSHEHELLITEFTGLESKREKFLTEKEKITERLFEDYELTYAAAAELDYEPVTEETRSGKVTEQNKLRSQIRSLGPVNVSSIEEYAQVKERYDFVHAQVQDLEKAKRDFLDIIDKLEKEMKTRFLDVFAKVNDNFKEVFRELFGGGNANLSLTDPENVLTSGIEITVAPPGKIIKNLKSLSGGEQVFVAIAIIFAILRVNPSPFCLFDEIESALDEVNVDRFADYAKRFSEKMQFIIITHRRGTMETADRLYGVTMQERGISKILTVDVGEVESKIGVKL